MQLIVNVLAWQILFRLENRPQEQEQHRGRQHWLQEPTLPLPPSVAVTAALSAACAARHCWWVFQRASSRHRSNKL